MGDASWALSSDLTQRVPGHSLIEELLRQWDAGTIRAENETVVIDEEAYGWYQGVQGERQVALELLQLGADYTVLHSVPVGASTSDIDHVVIGPGGVFTINSKYCLNKRVWFGGVGMYVGGSPVHYIRNSVHEAKRASKLLSRAVGVPVPVIPIIAFVDPADITSKAPAGTTEMPVLVAPHREVTDIIDRVPTLTSELVERIAAAAAIPGTWHEHPVESTRGDHVTKEFLALEAAIGPVAARRPAVAASQVAAAAERSPRGAPRRPRSARPVPRTRRPVPSLGRRLVGAGLRIGFTLLAGWLALQSLPVLMGTVLGALTER